MLDQISIMVPADIATSTVNIENIKRLSTEYIHLQHLEFDACKTHTDFDEFQLVTIHEMVRKWINNEVPAEMPKGWGIYFRNLRRILHENNRFRHYMVDRSKITFNQITGVMTFPLLSTLH